MAMRALDVLSSPRLIDQRKIGLLMLRSYLLVAFALVVVKVIEVAVNEGG